MSITAIYTVKPGDSVFSIARSFGVSTSRIISDNSVMDTRNLMPGQALVILKPETVYTVMRGDSISSISRKYAIAPIELLQNNPELINSSFLRVGQQLVINFTEPKIRSLSLNGFAYSHIDRGILRHALPYLTYFTVFGYGFTDGGDLIAPDDSELISLAYKYGAAPVMLLSSITENGSFDSRRASLLFADTALQDRVFEKLLAVMKEKGYMGLDIDFEYVDKADSGNFLNFIRRAAEKLRAEGYFTHVDLAPKTNARQAGLLYESHDYAAIGALADRVMLMTYEWGYAYGPPMAVAPLDKVREVAEYGVSEIPSEKIMLGLANYGYNWLLPYEKGVSRAVSIGNEYAVSLAAKNGVSISFDEISQSPYFNYFGREQREHVVWFEDAKSIEGKFLLMDELSLHGGGYWNLMRPFNQNWAFAGARYQINKLFDARL